MWRWLNTPGGPAAWREDAQGRCLRVALGEARGELFHGGRGAGAWLQAYFSGRRPPALPPLAPSATPFQAKLRAALLAIPYGETRAYGWLAESLGSSPRAVGRALGANPLPVFIPCHRVVAAGGEGGFSAGLAWKRLLLEIESGGG